jgi:hypothetical protein
MNPCHTKPWNFSAAKINNKNAFQNYKCIAPSDTLAFVHRWSKKEKNGGAMHLYFSEASFLLIFTK